MHVNQKSIIVIIGMLLAGVVLTVDCTAQGFSGIATYQSDRDMSNFQFQGEGMSPDMMDNLKEQLKKQFQKEYELKFTLTESIWKEVESLNSGPASASAGGMELSISMGGGLTYKNTESKTSTQQTEAFSKLFLITDQLEEKKWELTNNSKKIGNYTAFEAIYENVREVKTLSMSDEGKSTETRKDTTKVAVWYTPDIPVPHGPEEFWGLPGLILAVSNGDVTYMCTKVVLNPEKGLNIEKPKKGKSVTAKEFEELSQKMSAKMMKKYSGSGDEGDEHIMTISIGN